MTYTLIDRTHYLQYFTNSLDAISLSLPHCQNSLVGRTFSHNQKKPSVNHPIFWILHKINWCYYLTRHYTYYQNISSKINFEIINCIKKLGQVRNSIFISLTLLLLAYWSQILYPTIWISKDKALISRRKIVISFYKIFLTLNYKKYLLNLYQLFFNQPHWFQSIYSF